MLFVNVFFFFSVVFYIGILVITGIWIVLMKRIICKLLLFLYYLIWNSWIDHKALCKRYR